MPLSSDLHLCPAAFCKLKLLALASSALYDIPGMALIPIYLGLYLLAPLFFHCWLVGYAHRKGKSSAFTLPFPRPLTWSGYSRGYSWKPVCLILKQLWQSKNRSQQPKGGLDLYWGRLHAAGEHAGSLEHLCTHYSYHLRISKVCKTQDWGLPYQPVDALKELYSHNIVREALTFISSFLPYPLTLLLWENCY